MQKKIFIGLILTLVIVIFIPLYWAMEPGRQDAARERQQAEAVERGAELYTLQCTGCHGSGGGGGIGPPLKDSQLNEEALEKIIARGIVGTVMPAFGEEDGGPLKKHKIKDLVAFIKNWGSAPTPPEPPSVPTAPSLTTPQVPVPIAAGELYAGYCTACHGKNRQGVSGLGPPLIPESLAALSYTEIRDIILNGRSNTAMPSFKSTLSQEEIDALVQFVKDTSP